MKHNAHNRWGLLLELLSEMSDVDRQVVTQMREPGLFVPDDLLGRWFEVFQGGRGLEYVGVSQNVVTILVEFDHSLDQLIDILPESAADKVIFLRSDEIWQAVREMAGWTLDRIIDETVPSDVWFSSN